MLINNTSFGLARNNDLLDISPTVIEQQNILMYPYQLYPELKWSHDKQKKALKDKSQDWAETGFMIEGQINKIVLNKCFLFIL